MPPSLKEHRAAKAGEKDLDPKLVKAAIELLLPAEWRKSALARSKCEDFVHEALRVVKFEAERAERPVVLARAKKDVKKVIAALKRVRQIERLPLEMSTTFSGLDVDEYIRKAEQWLSLPAGPKHRAGHRQRAAVQAAAFLLTKYGHAPSTTRRGKWHKLSAILFGKPKADLFSHMTSYKKSAAPSRDGK